MVGVRVLIGNHISFSAGFRVTGVGDIGPRRVRYIKRLQAEGDYGGQSTESSIFRPTCGRTRGGLTPPNTHTHREARARVGQRMGYRRDC